MNPNIFIISWEYAVNMSGLCRNHAYKKQKACNTCANCPYCPPIKCRDERHLSLYNKIVGRKLRKRKGKAFSRVEKASRRSTRQRSGSVFDKIAAFDSLIANALGSSDGVAVDVADSRVAMIVDEEGADTEMIDATAVSMQQQAEIASSSSAGQKKAVLRRVKKNTLLTAPKSQARCSKLLLRAARKAVSAKAKELCPEDPALLESMCSPLAALESGQQKLMDAVSHCALTTTGVTSELCFSLLAGASANRSELESILFRAGNTASLERARIGRRRYHSLKEKAQIIQDGDTSILSRYFRKGRVYLKEETVQSALDWIYKTLPLRPGKLHSFRIGKILVADMPVLYLNSTLHGCYSKYKKDFPEKNQRLGELTFRKLLTRITDKTKVQAGLSYYYTDFLEVTEMTHQMLQRAAQIAKTTLPVRYEQQFKEIEDELNEVVNNIIYEYAKHVEKQSTISSHCMSHALGVESASTTHKQETCEECNQIFNFHKRLLHSFADIPGENPEFESMKRACPLIEEEFERFLAHILRTQWQAAACKESIQKAVKSKNTAVIILDHKQKVLARRLKESQVQYYAKKGMSLLGAMVIMGEDIPQQNSPSPTTPTQPECPSSPGSRFPRPSHSSQPKERRQVHHFIDIILENTAAQSASITCASIEALLGEIALKFPHIKQVHFQSDNAGPFTAQVLAPFCYLLNKLGGLPEVMRWIYTEAQSGKSMLDCHFAYINIWIDAWVRMAEDGTNIIFDPATLYTALTHDGGIKNSSTLLLRINKSKTMSINMDAKNPQPNVLNELPKGTMGHFKSGKKRGQPKPALFRLKMGVRKCHEFTLGQNPCAWEQSGLGKEELPLRDLVRQKAISLGPRVLQRTEGDAQCATKKAKQKRVPRMPPQSYESKASDAVLVDQMKVLRDNLLATPTTLPRRFTSSPLLAAPRPFAWAAKASRERREIEVDVVLRLAELYDAGVKEKTAKITAEAAYRDVMMNLIQHRWDQRIVVTPGKVKQLFSQTGGPKLSKKQKKVLEATDVASRHPPQHNDPEEDIAENSSDDDNYSVGGWRAEDEPDLLAPDLEYDDEEDFEPFGDAATL